ncbi:MAG: hypothetical protein ACI8P3_001326 [Saprospiraceae bacterium]|jgi:hypothetical protein
MKKTTIILMLLFLILGAGATWFFTKSASKSKATYSSSNMDFKMNPDLAYKIFLADKKGHKTTLIRKNKEWLLEGKEKIRPSAIAYLMQAIGGIEVKYRPSKSSYAQVTKNLAIFGIEVEIYGENDELLRNYYVGGVDEKGEGNYMIMAESDEPFATHLSSFVGGLRTRFAMTGDDWRDRSVFAEDPADISSVSIEYPRQKNRSFKLIKEGSVYKVEPLFKTTPILDGKIIAGKPDQFLQEFKSKVAENFQNEYDLKDYAKTITPFAIVSLTKNDGTEKTVRFIPFQKKGRDGELIKQDPNIPIFRFHADCSWGDFMLVQQGVFEKVFWGYESFYQ